MCTNSSCLGLSLVPCVWLSSRLLARDGACFTLCSRICDRLVIALQPRQSGRLQLSVLPPFEGISASVRRPCLVREKANTDGVETSVHPSVPQMTERHRLLKDVQDNEKCLDVQRVVTAEALVRLSSVMEKMPTLTEQQGA